MNVYKDYILKEKSFDDGNEKIQDHMTQFKKFLKLKEIKKGLFKEFSIKSIKISEGKQSITLCSGKLKVKQNYC